MSTSQSDPNANMQCAEQGCQFFGRPETGGYCSKCYKEKRERGSSTSDSNVNHFRSELSSSSSSITTANVDNNTSVAKNDEKTSSSLLPAKESSSSSNTAGSDEGTVIVGKKRKVQKNKSRCWECRKKVGLTGIECRCGYVFCGQHRYPDSHECTFDYKSFDRENLAKLNEKIEAEKLSEKL